MAAPVYTYLVADLVTNTVIDEIPLTGVSYSRALNDSGTVDATWDLSEAPSTRRRNPYDLTTPARRALYVLRDGRPMWGGIIWTRKYDSTSRKVTIGAADFWSYFDHRKVLPLLPPAPAVDYVAPLTTIYSGLDQNDIARRLVALAQSATGGDIGIELDDTVSGTIRDRSYHGYDLTDTGEALRKLCNVIDGPDMVFDVAATTASAPRRILRLGTPQLGQSGSAHVWEYGGNMLAYTWPSDGTRMVSREFATGDGIAEGMPIAVSEDRDIYAARWPLLESEDGYSSVTSPDVLQAHADADRRAGHLPVVLPTLTVRGTVAPIIGAFDAGDDGRVVIAGDDPFLPTGIDTRMRVITIKVTPSEQDETAHLTMAPLLDDVA